MNKLRCTSCGVTTDAKCDCGVDYIIVRPGKAAAIAIAKFPEKSDRVIAENIGVSPNTVKAARATVQNCAVDSRIGKDGKERRMPRKTKRQRFQELSDEEVGFRVTAEVIKRQPPGRMPNDTRQKFEAAIETILVELQRLDEFGDLGQYAPQMSNELRHLLADELRIIEKRARHAAKHMLGGNGDLRKITRPLCHVDIPLRKEGEA